MYCYAARRVGHSSPLGFCELGRTPYVALCDFGKKRRGAAIMPIGRIFEDHPVEGATASPPSRLELALPLM
jgi:hypothetical protein